MRSMSSRLSAGVLAALLGLLVAVVAPAAAAPRGGAGIGDPYFPLDGNGGYDALRYRIHDHYDFDSGRLSGRTRITLRPTQPLASFNLDFLLPVGSVRVDGVRARIDRPRAHELRVTPARPLAAGQVVDVVVRYAGHPSRYDYAGESNWLADEGEVVVMNEPHMAPWWFPANDHPSDLARIDVFITVPRGRQVISNGLLRGKRTGRHTVRWHWRSDSRMTTYNAFFVAGRYAVERGRTAGIPWINAASRRLGPTGVQRALAALRPSGEVTHWLAGLLGPYPFDATGGVVFALPQGFALENQTRPTYPFPPDRLLLVHELGHQWFGDAVPVARWRDIWLNEGFATWLEWRWTEEHGGPTANQRLADRYRSGTPAGPTEDPGVDRMWGQTPYLRGAMTLQALRNVLGEDAFGSLLRGWVADRAGLPSSSAEFEERAAQAAGRDLSAFFDTWLRDVDAPADTEANGLGGLLPSSD